jgi:hypothetical protein
MTHERVNPSQYLRELGCRALETLVEGLSPVLPPNAANENVETLRTALVARVLEDYVRKNAVEPEDLGSVYEGTLGFSLELACEALCVVEVRRKAGQAKLEIAVGLDSLLRSKGQARVETLQGLGVPVPHASRTSIARADSAEELSRSLATSCVAERQVPAGRYFLRRTGSRRQSGSHYTSRALAERVVELTLAPLLTGRDADGILALRVCDPAVGSGAFLVAACRVLSKRLADAWGEPNAVDALARARDEVAAKCLFGVDRDPLAIETAKMALSVSIGGSATTPQRFERNLVVGDALTGDFVAHFRGTVRSGAFHAFFGNPPWVSYAGRAAQPLEPELRAEFARYRAFAGYRNLQGLFVERCAELLEPGGRLGLVLPSSMSELAGYSATRRAHDRWCVPDHDLPDIGEGGFEGVFQPCMILMSTRRAHPLEVPPSETWRLERPDLDADDRALLEKLNRPPLPAHLFGERGLQSMGDDLVHLARAPDARHSVPIRCGSDVEPFRLAAASYHADPSWFGARLRAPEAWQSVRFVVRQTARVPIAALSDGAGFRNSLLAGFEDAAYPAPFLVAYLNSSPIRWLHYMRHRDARQGMPQLKILHLRSIVAPPHANLVGELTAAGAELSKRNGGLCAEEQEALDRRVAEAFDFSPREWEKVRTWAATLRA